MSTRRDLLRKGLLLSSSIAWAQDTASTTLRDIGSGKNLLVGTAVSFAQLQRPDFTRLLAAQASVVVPENEMKWALIHPEVDRFDFTRGDALVTFATEHDQKVRGHNLCWHEQLPGWFKQVATAQNAADLLRKHIARVAGHYTGRIHSWDVVNEAVQVSDGRPDGLRNSPWLQLIGPQYLDIAFQAARDADPHALLTYNDYDLEQDSPADEAKRQAVLALLRGLRDRDVPIQALGVQSHLKAGAAPSEWSGFHRFLENVERLNLQIFVTELDVDDSSLPGDIAERDRSVADLYRDYLQNVLAYRSVKAVLTWGLTDRDTWLNHSRRRKDGLPQRPLPFDADLKPTPAFFAMLDAIRFAPNR